MTDDKKSLFFVDVETSTPDSENKDLAVDPARNKLDLIGCQGDWQDAPIVVAAELTKDHFSCMDLAGHAFKFDYKTLHWKGYKLSVDQYVHDTLVMAVAAITKVPDEWLESYEKERRRLNAELPDGQKYREAQKHSLKVLAPYFLGVSPFWENPATTNDPEYLKKDVQYTKGLFDHFVPMLKKDGVWQFYNDRLIPWQRMTLEAELDGICINLQTLEELKQQAEAGVITSLAKLRAAWTKVEEEYAHYQKQAILLNYETKKTAALAKLKEDKKPEKTAAKRATTSLRYDSLRDKALAKLEPFNYASPSQLLWAFKEVLRYPVTNMEGDETTGASVLELLAAQGKDDIKALLDYKGNYKLAHSYFPSYASLVLNGRIHCSFNLHGTRTGRLSCSDPNLQQVPPILKRVFEAAEGNVLVSQDLSAIEPVLIAYYTEDANLCRILINGEDFHGVAAVQFNLVSCQAHEVKAKEPEVRYAAKQGDLSIFYGSGKRRLFTTLTLNGIKQVKGKPLTEDLCSHMVRNFRDYFKESWEFKQLLDAEALSGNYIENMFGRRFRIENPEDVYMKCFNRLIQGSASDMLLAACHDCLQELKAKGIWARLRLLVHDNGVLECQEKDGAYVNERLCYHMTKFKLPTKHGNIPLKVEGSFGKNWKC